MALFTFLPVFSYRIVFQCEAMPVFITVVVQMYKLMDIVRCIMFFFFALPTKINLHHIGGTEVEDPL